MLIENDLFINFNFTTKNEAVIRKAEELLSSLDVGNRLLECKKAFLINLLINLKCSYTKNRPLIIQRNKQWYAERLSENYPIYQTYAVVRTVLDELVRNDYLEVRPHVNKRVTTGYRAKPSLIEFMNSVNENNIDIIRPSNFIILRKFDSAERKTEIRYRNTAEILGMKRDMENYSTVRENHVLSINQLPAELYFEYSDKIEMFSQNFLSNAIHSEGVYNIPLRMTYLTRIFNVNFQRGGRFYRGVESNIPSEVRKYIHINGNHTVELDYGGHHYRMLYNQKGIDYREDPYQVEANLTPEIRKIYKAVALICLNTGSLNSAYRAIRKKLREDNLTQYLPDTRNVTLKDYFDKFIARNRPLEAEMFSEKCHELMNIDSNIANKILIHFANQNILALCVHDSFIVEQRHEDELREVMVKEYRSVMGFTPVIE